MNSDIVEYLLNVGAARTEALSILKNEWLDCLSKYDPYWGSEYEVECEKLDECRRRLSYMRDELWKIVGHLTIQRHEKEKDS